jgi:hypothetical protein
MMLSFRGLTAESIPVQSLIGMDCRVKPDNDKVKPDNDKIGPGATAYRHSATWCCHSAA